MKHLACLLALSLSACGIKQTKAQEAPISLIELFKPCLGLMWDACADTQPSYTYAVYYSIPRDRYALEYTINGDQIIVQLAHNGIIEAVELNHGEFFDLNAGVLK